MTNMEDSFHGVELIKDYHVCIGLHVNISTGFPLTDPALIPSLVSETGEFKSSKQYRSASEDFVNYEQVLLEVEAQYLKFVELVGRKPEYFEGHAVASANFFKALEAIASKYGCDYLPVGFDGTATFKKQKLSVYMDSMKADYDPLLTLKKCVTEIHENEIGMLVLHPGYVDDYLLNHSTLTYARELEVAMVEDKDTKEWLEQSGVKLISYRDIS